ncbi:hypothetical protein VZT92_003318 [Zoarces viviparus]|uniref:Ig-like domain-containing protein n=1 Tax=Zoarces viviparus TaxID=48416 RepID=A0AAW1G1A1_ZOAVI
MSEFRWIKTSLSLILVLQFTAAATGQRYPSVAVRDGDDVSLPCDNVIDDHENCDSTTWLFTDSISSTATVKLVKDGQMGEEAEAKSDRLSVSENCSLVIQKVTDEDAGAYVCRQFRSGRQEEGPDAVLLLSVVTMTEHEDGDEVTLSCSVTIYEGFDHAVKWLLQGPDVEEDTADFKTSQAECSASLTFPTSHFIYTSRFRSLKCEVTRGDSVQQFSFRNSPSGDDTITATTESTPAEAANITTPSAVSDASPKPQSWWTFISVSAGAALIMIVEDKN